MFDRMETKIDHQTEKKNENESKSIEIKVITTNSNVIHLFDDCRHVKRMSKATVQKYGNVCLHCQGDLQKKMAMSEKMN